MPIRVFLISDFRLLVHGIETLLDQHAPRFARAGRADTLDGAVEAVLAARADLVLLDLDTAPARTIATVGALHAAAPQVPVLLLTRLADSALQDQAVIAGARGVIDATTAPELFLAALDKVVAGQIWLDRAATGRIFVEFSRHSSGAHDDPVAARLAQLTEREQDIVICLLRHSDDAGKALARRLNISESTLRNHLTSIYGKFGVSNRSGLLAFAFHNRLSERLGPLHGAERHPQSARLNITIPG
ncbi:response regulator transcription factor [Thauera aromatica]|uniref:response regulator n=1 Tax=Thauera aromatica TaxID=59405 RepID=UPI001FFD30D8|nr:response regulator transcription factor [Thauera aromatica]MCK2088978.1 response regulator transcription factor [Thauera aromatica]